MTLICWRKILATSYAEEALDERLRQATLTGKPLGDADFLQQLGPRLSRDETSRHRDRPSSAVNSPTLQAGAGPKKKEPLGTVTLLPVTAQGKVMPGVKGTDAQLI